MIKITTKIKEQIKEMIEGGFDNQEIQLQIFGTQSHVNSPYSSSLIQLLRRQHKRQMECVHPRDKRQYVGMGYLKCHVCGLEFQ